MEQFSYNEEQWHNELERRCRDILADALKGYPDYLWVNTFREDYLDEYYLGDGCITEVSIKFQIQSGNDFGFPIFTYGLACFRFNLTSMNEKPSVYGLFTRDDREMEFTIEPLDVVEKTIWVLELSKGGWYNV